MDVANDTMVSLARIVLLLSEALMAFLMECDEKKISTIRNLLFAHPDTSKLKRNTSIDQRETRSMTLTLKHRYRDYVH